MKLASLKAKDRDGALIVVDRGLTRFVPATGIAATLREALENWTEVAPRLEETYAALNAGRAQGAQPFDAHSVESPLPRTFQFLDGSVYLSHMQKARKARGAAMPPNFDTEPLMYQGLSDHFIGPTDDMLLPSEDLGIDIEAEIAVVTDDVPMGVSAAGAAAHIRLVMLLNDYTLRSLTATELPKGFGFLQAKPTSSFSPVAVTPDELPQWDGEKLNVRLRSWVNGVPLGQPHAGTDMFFTYPQLIAHAARTRRLTAGTIVGAGTVANVDETSGCACIAEMRANEALSDGAARSSFLKFGDQVRIEVLDEAGASIFGAIDQRVMPATA